MRRKLICDELERITVEAFHMQIDKETLADWFSAAMEKFNLASGKRVGRAMFIEGGNERR